MSTWLCLSQSLACLDAIATAIDCFPNDVPEGVQDGAAWRLAGHRLVLQQRRIDLLLEGRVEGADGDCNACVSRCRIHVLVQWTGSAYQRASTLPVVHNVSHECS